MSTSLDMSLDDIIAMNNLSVGGRSNNFRGRGRGRGRGKPSFYGSAYGPDRRFARYPMRPEPYPTRARTLALEPVMLQSEWPDEESGTKLYISNLDHGVSNHDIKLLFSDVGELKKHSVHYDKSGRSKGTAEVVFARKADALASIERYNKVQLDGKPMKIELVGVDLLTPPVLITATSNIGRPYGISRSYHESFGARGRGHGGVRGRGFSKGQGQGRHHGEKVTAEELDADLERYHFEAMKIS